MAARIGLARLEAVRRSSAVAYRFVPAGADYRFTAHVDGNGNGVRTIEISNGVDLTLAAPSGSTTNTQGFVLVCCRVPDLDGARGSETAYGLARRAF